MNWKYLHPRGRELAGYIPGFIFDENPKSAAEQIDRAYAHGGGWNAFGQGKWQLGAGNILKYPGDPSYKPVAEAILHEGTEKPETIIIYEHAWVCIKQADGSFEVARLD